MVDGLLQSAARQAVAGSPAPGASSAVSSPEHCVSASPDTGVQVATVDSFQVHRHEVVVCSLHAAALLCDVRLALPVQGATLDLT